MILKLIVIYNDWRVQINISILFVKVVHSCRRSMQHIKRESLPFRCRAPLQVVILTSDWFGDK